MKYNEMMDVEEIEVTERIRAMRAQEENATRCRNYLTSVVDASSRKAMVDWCFVVCDSFGLDRESVAIAMSIVDRYLSSDKGKSAEALQNKQKFQLAAITSFYMAVKVNEPTQLGIEMLMKICRGYYKESTVFSMELDILAALEWRVCVSSTTPMEYVRQFLKLLPEWQDMAGVISENAMLHMDSATSDIYFSGCKASTVGVAILAGAMNDTYTLSPLERDVMWHQLSRKLDNFDLASKEIRKVELELLAKSTSSEPKRKSRASLPRPSISKSGEQQSSPVSVIQMAR